jgi:predicted dehydrogenase
MRELPAARTPDPLDAPPLRWGIMGPGWIAERFARALHANTRQVVTAVGSRRLERSREFAARLGIPRAHGSYEALVADPEIDAVYIATPHTAHHACALLSIEAGKHTLVEKPLALDAIEGGEIAAAARERGVFCMEALWTFFLPKFDVIRRVIDAGLLGELRTVIADNGEFFGPDHRIMRPELAGGPLYDLGTYPLALAIALLGAPEHVLACGQDAPSGVIGQASIMLAHTGGNQSVIHTTIQAQTPTTAVLAGTEATLTIAGRFYMPGAFTVTTHDGRRTYAHDEPAIGHNALHFEAAEVARCVSEGQLESPTRPLADSIRMLHVLDAVHADIGASLATH